MDYKGESGLWWRWGGWVDEERLWWRSRHHCSGLSGNTKKWSKSTTGREHNESSSTKLPSRQRLRSKWEKPPTTTTTKSLLLLSHNCFSVQTVSQLFCTRFIGRNKTFVGGGESKRFTEIWNLADVFSQTLSKILRMHFSQVDAWKNVQQSLYKTKSNQ